MPDGAVGITSNHDHYGHTSSQPLMWTSAELWRSEEIAFENSSGSHPGSEVEVEVGK